MILRPVIPLLLLLLLLPSQAQQVPETRASQADFLAAAAASGRHFSLLRRPNSRPLTWPASEDPGAPVVTNLYSGMPAGVLLLGLLKRAADPKAGSRFEVSLEGLLQALKREPASSFQPGLYTGRAGVGWLLLEAAPLSQRKDLKAEATRALDAILAHGRREGDGLHWGTGTDIISGASGVGLFLLRAWRGLEADRALQAARAAGRWLISQRIVDGEGWKWAVTPRHSRIYPNFSHGTAGIGTFLLRLHAATGERAFLDAGLRASSWLEAKAIGDEQACTWFHHEGDGEQLFYVSWCHGPAGTARFYEELYQVTKDLRWRKRVLACGEWLLRSGIPTPKKPINGYWNRGACCGDAGIGDFYCDLFALTGDRRWLDAARAMARHLIRTARRGPGTLSWLQAEHRVRPEQRNVQMGWAQGSAGVGLFLLRLHLLEKGAEHPTWQFPDNPFPTLR